MKQYAWLSLPLAFALALPVAAQTAYPPAQDTSQQAPAASTSSSQPAQAASDQTTTATGHEPLAVETREGFWGKLNPFARKKYVQRQMSPIKDRVNELDELTAKNTQMIKDVDSRAQAGIQMASNKANEADMHAVDAGNRATQANQTAQQASGRLQNVSQVVGNIDQYKQSFQLEVRFRPGQAVLSKSAKNALDEMASPLKDSKGYIVEVQGFASGRGQAAIEDSQRMADAVVRYLVLNGEVPVYRIFTLGMGNAPMPADAEGKRPRRINGGRVEISLLKNGVDQLASDMAAASSPAATPAATPAAAPSNQSGTSDTSTQPQQTAPQTVQPQQPQQATPPPAQSNPNSDTTTPPPSGSTPQR